MPGRRRNADPIDHVFARISETARSPRSARRARPVRLNFYTQWRLDKVKDTAARQKEHRARTPEEQLAELDRRLGEGAGAAKEREKLAPQESQQAS